MMLLFHFQKVLLGKQKNTLLKKIEIIPLLINIKPFFKKRVKPEKKNPIILYAGQIKKNKRSA